MNRLTDLNPTVQIGEFTTTRQDFFQGRTKKVGVSIFAWDGAERVHRKRG
jgi:hypothetical protein